MEKSVLRKKHFKEVKSTRVGKRIRCVDREDRIEADSQVSSSRKGRTKEGFCVWG